MDGFHLVEGALVVRSTAGLLEILRLSASGLSFRPRSAEPPPTGKLEIRLGPGDDSLTAENIQPRGDGVLSARWQTMSLAQARNLARFIHGLIERHIAISPRAKVLESEEISDPVRIRSVLSALFANRCQARIVTPDGGGASIRVAAGRIEPESDTPLQWECEKAWPAPPFHLLVEGFMSLIDFEVDRVAEVDGFLAVPVPTKLRRERNRTQRRAKVTGDVLIAFDHPLWPDLHVQRRVRDVSLDGLQMACSAIKDVLHPGLRLPEVTVTWNDRIVCRATAEVHHVGDDIDGEAELAGLSLSFADDHDRAHYHEQVDRLLYPNTRADGTWAQQLWELFRSSGYLGLSHKSEPEFVALKDAFAKASARLARSHLGRQVVWPSSRGLEASVQSLRCYERGFVMYALARRQGRVPMRFPGRAILRDVYLHAVEDMQRHGDVGWLIVWIQSAARFTKMVHVDLPLRYAESGRMLLWPFRALEADVTAAQSPVPSGVELMTAGASDVERFLDHVQRTRSPHYIDAHDLAPGTFDQRRLRAEWAEAGFRRGRLLWVAKRGTRPIAYSLLESADDGLHLFRLLDVARFYALEPGDEAAFPALLDAARRWYAGQGKQRFICFAENDQFPDLAPVQLRDLGGADAVLLPTALLPELLETVYEVTAPRDVSRLPSK